MLVHCSTRTGVNVAVCVHTPVAMRGVHVGNGAIFFGNVAHGDLDV